MKKLKNIREPWFVGLSLGTTSHGFAATDGDGRVLRHGNRPVMGTRVFKEALHASDARMPRAARRRIQRKRGREREMERVFAPLISQIDPDFFIRRRMSYKLGRPTRDGDTCAFAYRKRLNKYPTLAHLDVDLMTSDSAIDIRLVFDAVTNHVTRRGHFLIDGPLDSSNADVMTQIDDLATSLQDAVRDLDETADIDIDALSAINGKMTARELHALVTDAVGFRGESLVKKVATRQTKAVADLVSGYKAELGPLTRDGSNLGKVSVADSDALEEFIDESCPDALAPVLEASRALYSAWKLQGILSYAPGKTLSENQVAQYDLYRNQLRTLKDLGLKYVARRSDATAIVDPEGFRKYCTFFCGPKRTDRYDYDKVLVKKADSPKNNMGYTAYNMKLLSYEDFAKRVKLLFKDTDAEFDPDYIEMMDGFADHRFLRRLHTVDNAAVPHQLHAEVVSKIIDNQGRFYPRLLEQKDHILKVLNSRIPYYVGPLSTQGAPKGASGESRFSWVKIEPGHENERIAPWNWENHIDVDATAERFIRRMTGKCTYIEGEDVLPKNSIAYERYCFLNELANLRYTEDGDTWLPLDARQRRAIELAARDGGTMTVTQIENILKNDFNLIHPHVKGTSNPKAMSSRLANYAWFCSLLGTENLTASDISMAEDIILWNTVFEDRDILRHKVAETYGDLLTGTQIAEIARKRLGGWGKLSRFLLEGIWVETDAGERCIMDVLADGNPNGRFKGSAMNLIQILHDGRLGFKREIDRINEDRLKQESGFDINALPGSPAMRRGIDQAIKVLDDMVSVAGSAPEKIYLGVHRDASAANKGSNPKKRIEKLKDAYKKLTPKLADALDAKRMLSELSRLEPEKMDERTYLYFLQAGTCVYSGRKLHLSDISAPTANVDRILPRSIRKDESLDNKALVLASENRYKTEGLVVPEDVKRRMAPFWRKLNEAGLMSDKKLGALMRDRISEQMLASCINRALSETSWELKLFKAVVAAKYPMTEIVSVKDGIIDSVRSVMDIQKSSRANWSWRAHDALIGIGVGRYMEIAIPSFFTDRVDYERCMKAAAARMRQNHKTPKSQLDFITGGFFQNRLDPDTGDVLWDFESETSDLIRSCNWTNLRTVFAPFQEGGAYWNATLYSPRAKSKLIPTKTDRPAELYGGYTTQTFANFFIYSVNVKTGQALRFGSVPLRLLMDDAATGTYTDRLEAYAKHLADAAGEQFVKIVRPRLLKNTVFSAYGERFRIAGERAAYPVRQLPVKDADLALLQTVERIADRKDVLAHGTEEREAEGAVLDLWQFIETLFPKIYPILSSRIGLNGLMSPRAVFDKADGGDLGDLIKRVAQVEVQVFEMATGLRGTVDTTVLGGVSYGGKCLFNYDKVLNDEKANFHLIDSSPAGLRVDVSRLI